MADSIIDQIMSFDSNELNIFQENPETNNYDVNIYKTNPVKLSKSEDGHYHAKLRILYNPFNIKESIIKQATYSMHDCEGFFMVKSKLADGDKSCPLFTSWKKLHFSQDPTKINIDGTLYTRKEWGDHMYEKNESQWCLVQILEDANQPELVGQFKAMKLPKAIYTKLSAKMHPSVESKKDPIAIMDFLIGKVLTMEVVPGPKDPAHPEREQREIKYDLCDFDDDYAPIIKTDGTPLFTDAEIEVIDSYNDAKDAEMKAKSEAKKKAAKETISSLAPQLHDLYQKALDYMKANAIDIVKECKYQPWDEATTKRVNNWITLVQEFKNPQTAGYAPEVPAEEPVKEPEAETTATEDPGDDLPF